MDARASTACEPFARQSPSIELGSDIPDNDAELYRFFDAVADAVCITDDDLDGGPRILYVNPAFEAMTGWPASDIVGMTPRVLQGPLTDRSVFQTLRDVLSEGRSWRGEAVNYRRDGSRFLMEWTITPYRATDQRSLFIALQRDVSQRWHDGLKLAEQARRLEIAQRTARLGHWSLCTKTRRLRFSDTALELWGVEPGSEAAAALRDRVTLAWWKQTVHRDDRAGLNAITPRMTEPVSLLYRIARQDGREAWIKTVAELETDDEGAITRISGIHQDVSEEAEARRHEQAALTQLNEALESSPDAVMLLDSDERVITANSAFRRLYPKTAPLIEAGRDIKEILRAKIDNSEYYIVGSPEGWLEERLARLRHPPQDPWEQRMTDGRVQSVTERRTASGGYISIRRDITESKKAQALLEKRQRAIEASADGIAIAESNGRLSYVNRACANLFGFRPEDMMQRHWGTFYDTASYGERAGDINETLGRYGRWQGELLAVRANEGGGLGAKVEHEVSLTLLEDGSLIAVMRDIAERRQAQQQREGLIRQFNAAQKMESLGLMAGGIAHDFNNILSSILGYGSFLVEDLQDRPEQQHFARKIVAGGESAKHVIEQILAFSRRRNDERTLCDFRLAVREVRDMLEVSLPSTVELTAELDDEPVIVAGSLAELGQIAMNLAVNARDALAGAPGSVQIVLRSGLAGDYVQIDDSGADSDDRVEAAKVPQSITFSDRVNGRFRLTAGRIAPERRVAILTVEDSGKGMDRQTLERIFEPFFSTKGESGGTGLGLAAVYGIVTGNGGALAVETAPGYGTRFDILWPLAELADMPKQPAVEEAEKGTGRILVVDDEEAVLDATATRLSRLGYQVDALNSPVDAAEIVLGMPDLYDLLLLDQTMPEMTGLELVATLREAGVDVPIFIHSGFDAALEHLDINEAGIQGVLRKPLDFAALSKTIKNAIG